MNKETFSTISHMLIRVEDRRFYTHRGIDLRAIARAFLANIKARRYVQGGSTITQQLVRTLYLNRQKTLFRKLTEIIVALWIETQMSKEEILRKYMSSIYMGHRNGRAVRGLEEASNVWLGKAIDDTDWNEKAQLVAMVKGPNLYVPGSYRGDARAKLVRNLAFWDR